MGVEDSSEDRYRHQRARLPCGVLHAGGETRLLLADTREQQRCQRREGDGAGEADQQQPERDLTIRTAGVGRREHGDAQSAAGEAGNQQHRMAKPTGQPRIDQKWPGQRPHGQGQQCDSRRSRTPAAHLLEVQRHQEERPVEHETHQRRGDHGHGAYAVGEEHRRQHRLADASLADPECSPHEQAREQHADRDRRLPPGLAAVDDCRGHEAHGEHRGHLTETIDATGMARRLGDADPCEQHADDTDRHVDQEHAAPSELIDQQPANQRPEGNRARSYPHPHDRSSRPPLTVSRIGTG